MTKQKLSLYDPPRRDVTPWVKLRAELIRVEQKAARKRDRDARMRAAMARLDHIK